MIVQRANDRMDGMHRGHLSGMLMLFLLLTEGMEGLMSGFGHSRAGCMLNARRSRGYVMRDGQGVFAKRVGRYRGVLN